MEPTTSPSALSARFPTIVALIRESEDLDVAGQIAAGFARAQEALAQARACGEPEAVAASLAAVGWMHLRLGHYDLARTLATEALAHAASDVPARADALVVLSVCAGETDDLDAAEQFLQGALDLGRQLGHHLGLYRALHGLSTLVYWPRGRFALALAADKEALQVASAAGMPAVTYGPLIIVSDIYLKTGERAQARAALERLGRVVQPGAAPEGYFCCLSGHLARDQGKLADALTLYQRARAIADATGEPWLLVESRRSLSSYHRTSGNLPEAQAWADDAVGMAGRLGYRHALGVALAERARVAWAAKEFATAETDLRAAVEVLESLKAAFDLAYARFLLAALLHERPSQSSEARQAWLAAARSIAGGAYAYLLERERDLAFPLVATYLHDSDAEVEGISRMVVERLARVPALPLRITTLGWFEVWQGTRPIPKQTWRQRRAGELFRLLLISPQRSLPCEQAMEILWPERPPDSVRAQFHHTTSAIRQALEPELPDKFPSRYLQVEAGRVSLRLPPDSEVDFETFETHCRAGEWEAALSLYAGDLFPDDLAADWSAALRERLAQLSVQALCALAQRRLEAGQPQEALGLCRQALVRDAWQETACLLGMRACLALGDRAGAIRLYREMARTLRTDLGVAPQPEIQALYRSITR